MDSHYEVDTTRLAHLIRSQDVILVRFDTIEPCLLLDLRTNHLAGPLVSLVERDVTVEQRLETIRLLRPDFPRPRGVRIVRWPRHVQSLRALGIWDEIVRRLVFAGVADAAEVMDRLFATLVAEEQTTIRAIIRGHRPVTAWQRVRS